MRNYQDFIDAIIVACDDIIDAMGADGAPLWPARIYGAVLRIKHMAVHLDVNSGDRAIYDQSLKMISDVKILSGSWRHDKNEARTGMAMQRKYDKLLTIICDLNVAALYACQTP